MLHGFISVLALCKAKLKTERRERVFRIADYLGPAPTVPLETRDLFCRIRRRTLQWLTNSRVCGLSTCLTLDRNHSLCPLRKVPTFAAGRMALGFSLGDRLKIGVLVLGAAVPAVSGPDRRGRGGRHFSISMDVRQIPDGRVSAPRI